MRVKDFFGWINDVRQRRLFLTYFSGGLILLGLGLRYLAGLPQWADILLVLAVASAGSDIALRAYANLKNRAFSIELLVTIAATGAIVIGDYWEAAAVTFLFIFGAYLEARTLTRTREVLTSLLDMAPVTAVVLRGGVQVTIPAYEVNAGETVIIKPGAKIPVDGQVIDGFSAVDESVITGEPFPEEKSSGSQVFAGTFNQDGVLQITATGVGADTTLARIIRRVEEAQEAKAPTQRFIERFSRWYTPAIIALSVGAFLLTQDIELSLTLLVIGCPGALVISTPVSIVAGIGSAARKGILIKGGEYLENAAKISTVALDKTGTLTKGKPALVEILVLERMAVPAGLAGEINNPGNLPFAENGSGRWDEDQLQILHWAQIAEAGSEHPLARPILAADGLTEIPMPDKFSMKAGKGVIAEYRGTRISVGNLGLMEDLNIEILPDVGRKLAQLRETGATAVITALDQQAVGILGIADTVRPNAARMVQVLKHSGVKNIVMLTGDDLQTAQAIAAETGITQVHAGLLPEDKLSLIRRYQQQGEMVAMIGDGINDAPALAAANIGIAIGASGAGVAIETADIALMSDDLLKVPESIRLSKNVLKNIRQNVMIALVTVAALLSGVLVGQVHMAGGMLIHQASVLVVIFNGMRLLKHA